MKKILNSLLFLIAFIGVVQGQPTSSDFWIHGTVKNSTTNVGIPNHQVLIVEPAENNTPGFTDTTYTDNTGYYSYVVWGGSTIGPNRNYAARTLDCQNTPHYVTMMSNQGTTDSYEANFIICDNGTGCQAGFITTPQNNNPQGIYFGNASTVPSGTITSWSWSYGDGTGQQSPQPNISSYHEYANPGTYIACFTITTSEGCTSTFCDSIVVLSLCSGLAGFTSNTSPTSLTATLVGTFDGVINNQATYQWSYGDGSNGTGGPTNQHTYDSAGTYYVCVTVTFNGCSDTYCDYITVGNTCNASFTINQGNAPLTYYVSPTISGGNWIITPGNLQPNPNGVLTFPNAGTYNVCYTVASNGITCDHCATVVVTNSNGNCSTTLNVTPLNSHEFSFFAASSGTAPFVFTYNFGDGANQTFTNQPVSHSYSSPGTYTVCVYITDANGCIASDCETVVVTTGSGCQAYFYGNPLNPNNLNDLAIQFTNYSVSGDSLHPITGYSWNFGDGESSTLQNPIHDYLVAGVYNVCLTVYNNFGCQSTYCDTVVVGNPGNTGCIANFSYSSSNTGLTVFNNLSDSNNNGTIVSYQWSFGDGTSSTDENPTHTFGFFGQNAACLTITTSNGCTSTICDSIVFGSNGGCQAAFVAIIAQNNPYEYHFQSSNSGNDYLLEWTINNILYTPAYDQQDFNYVFPDSGIYVVCLTISDNNGCQNTICQTIVVGSNGNPSGGCDPSFTVNTNVNVFNSVQFIPVGNQNVTNYWSFGDGQTSSNNDPVHVYANPGTYYVCHYISGTNCQSSFCDSVVVGLDSIPSNGSISGNVYVTNSTLASVAYVFLLQMDYPNSQIVPADANVVQNGGYSFTNVPNGDYLVKAALTPNDPFYANRIPTYYTTAAYWFDADVITVNNNNITGADIHMIQASNNGGPGFIGGSVNWADTLRASSNFAGATVIVEDMQGNIITYVIADQNGNYSIPNLAYGTYKLTADFPGVTGDPVFVTITPFEPSASGVQIIMGPATVGVKEDASIINALNLFPNPATENATLMIETAKPAELTLTIVNLMGQTVSGQTVLTNTGKTFVQLPLDNIAQGIYTIILRDSKGVAKVQKLVKR